MSYFVDKDSVVRKIWGSADTIMFIFAGASAEFALNKSVDWLYFTGKLPADPLGRLFSTVAYARMIVFSPYQDAMRAIDQITAIHQQVEQARGMNIPDWAYRDVLFMLIDYSVRSFELLERQLSDKEKEEVFNVFYKVGNRMGIQGLPADYRRWLLMRKEHLQDNLVVSEFTRDLFRQYKKHLGAGRYILLKEVQKIVSPPQVTQLLALGSPAIIRQIIAAYKVSKRLKLDHVLKHAILPPQYLQQIKALDN
ncbi:DUF2236 domain-containing protein [Mucilaginibacter sp. RS28]|uniref:DUF2236 domain-containing protein n=1 Tax=Mucilaginibacter straminoryzae TaxID=2932774 RepID=A0A9X1X0U0_9SPHI|nr:oxygenase MpaB family protein [Mucilaginibacter straminoryzae]MCJ8209152.1 DUF2236 domain-containing protein [Mucilaginibacter straminoryzae]